MHYATRGYVESSKGEFGRAVVSEAPGWRRIDVKRLLTTLGIAMLISGCTSTPLVSPDVSRPSEPVVQKPEVAANPHESDLAGRVDILAGLSLRDVVADSTGRSFIVQDENMSLFRVSASAGTSRLGEAPEIGLLAAWGENDYGFAFARKSATDTSYEIVGVGHAGSKVLAKAVGYPGDIKFIGQEVHFIDSEGWKAVTWSGSPVLKASLSLGPRGNQRAWCAWSTPAPFCIGGYWDPANDSSTELTIVRAGEPAHNIMTKGPYPILGAGDVSTDGRLVAASLGARSAGAPSPGKVVVAWLDQEGMPMKTKEFPLLARELFFDASGRLIAHVYPQDGAGNGDILILNPDDGSTVTLGQQAPSGPYSLNIAPDRKKLYILPAAGGVRGFSLATP